jgi:hypothetical protein
MSQGQFILDSDANNVGLGTTYLQMQKRWKEYFSKSLAKPKRWYVITRKELLAVRHFDFTIIKRESLK